MRSQSAQRKQAGLILDRLNGIGVLGWALIVSGCGVQDAVTSTDPDRPSLASTVTPDGSSSTNDPAPPTFSISLTLDSPSVSGSTDASAGTVVEDPVPVADAGLDRVVIPGEIVVLNASDSTWDRREAVSFQWTQREGTPVEVADPHARLTTFLVPLESPLDDTLVFDLVVLQGAFHAEDSVSLTVALEPDNAVTIEDREGSVTLSTGIGLNPRSWNLEHVHEAFDKVATVAQVGFVQVPFSWDRLNGRFGYPTYTRNYNWLIENDPATGKNLFEQYGLQKAFAFDFLIPGGAPGSLSVSGYSGNASFQNSTLATAFVAECIWIAEYFEPDFLAIGVEIDSYLEVASTAERFALQDALAQAFDAIKARHRDMTVFCYFQYEGVKSRDLWNVIRPFAGLSDMTAFSTYPSSPVATAPDGFSAVSLPDDYYADIETRLGLSQPVAFVEVGHPARPTPLFAAGSQAEQAMFVERFFEVIPSNTTLALWTYLFDPDLSSVYPPDIANHFGAMGQLRLSDPTNRLPSWSPR